MARTLEQKIAALDAKIARLRQKNRKLETGQKIILGGLLLNAARKNKSIQDWLINEIAENVTRPIDKKRLAPIVNDLLKN